MITDEIMEAIEMMISNCEGTEQRKGMESLSNMLEDFDEYSWLKMNDNERKNWIDQFKME